MMNEKVTKIVDLLFQDIMPSEEVQVLREEVLNNCQERFADLMNSGLSEEESLAAVAESLKGMDDVLGEYPKTQEPRQERTEAEKEVPAEKQDEKAPAFSRFAPEQIRALDFQLTNCDLEVSESEEAEATLEVEGSIRMKLTEDGKLCLWQDRVSDHLLRGINLEESLSSFEQLGHTLGQLGQNISQFLSMGFGGQEPGKCRVILRMPGAVHPEVRIRTTSGEISWRDLVPGKSMILRTTSGEIKVQADRNYLLPRVEISTTSGDADLSFNAEDLKVSSVSGDLFWRGEARRLAMNSTSGDTDAAGVLQEAKLNTTSGDLSLELTAETPAEIQVNSVSGDIDLRLPHSVREVCAQLKSVSGEIHLRGVEQAEEAAIRLLANTVSGDVKICA